MYVDEQHGGEFPGDELRVSFNAFYNLMKRFINSTTSFLALKFSTRFNMNYGRQELIGWVKTGAVRKT